MLESFAGSFKKMAVIHSIVRAKALYELEKRHPMDNETTGEHSDNEGDLYFHRFAKYPELRWKKVKKIFRAYFLEASRYQCVLFNWIWIKKKYRLKNNSTKIPV